MFIRCTTKKVNGVSYYAYKLVETYRSDRGPRQRDLLNFGSDFDLPREEWRSLANRIEEIITTQTSLLPVPEHIESMAQRYAMLLIKKQSVISQENSNHELTPPDNESLKKRFVSVDILSTTNKHARTIGCEYILYSMFKELKLDKCLKKLGLNNKQIQVATATIIARAAFPASEHRTHFLLSNVSAVDELLKTDFSNLPLHYLYKISDRLLNCKSSLETHLDREEKNIFGFKDTILLYDITNSHMEGLALANPKAKYGRSKQKRSDCPLVSLGLVLNQQGFPKRSAFLEGNVVETKAFAQAIKTLTEENDFLSKPTIVIDAGIASQENLDWLKEHHYNYVTVFRSKRRAFPDTGEWTEVKNHQGNLVKALLVEDENGKEKHLYCQSSGRKRREIGLKSRLQQTFEKDLAYLNSKLHVSYWRNNYERVVEKIGKLRQKYTRISRFYEISIVKDDEGHPIRIDYQVEKSSVDAQFNGSYCLRTDLKGVEAKELWKIYMSLSNAEEAFRDLKSHLGLRPMYHHKEERIDGHMWITLLAYHLVHSILERLRMNGLNLSWSNVRDRLRTHERVTTCQKTEDGRTIHIRNTTEPEQYQREIYRALQLPQNPLPMTIVEV